MWIFVKLVESGPGRATCTLILMLLCIHPYIQIFKYRDFSQHKEQVVIEQTICDGFTWDDREHYYDGVDYLNFTLDVSFKKEEVASFNAHTVVFKGDQYIGYINSDFKGTSQRPKKNNTQSYFETNSNQKLSFYISHPTNTSWQNDALFKELYYGNLEEFRFETNIICVYFTDGTRVGHYFSLLSDFYYDENGVIHYRDQKSDEKKYYYYDEKGKKHYTKNKSDNVNGDESSNTNDVNSNDDVNNEVNNQVSNNDINHNNGNPNNNLLDLVKNYAGEDALLPDNYSTFENPVSDCGWYSDADGEYYHSYYVFFKIDEENHSTFTNDFINKLIDNGYSLRWDKYNYEYVKNNTVICFSDVKESRVYNPSTDSEKVDYYYMSYYAYPLN